MAGTLPQYCPHPTLQQISSCRPPRMASRHLQEEKTLRVLETDSRAWPSIQDNVSCRLLRLEDTENTYETPGRALLDTETKI